MNKKSIIVFAFLSLIVTIAIYNLKWPEEEKKITHKIFINKCNVQKQACRVELNEFKMELSFDENIYYLKKFSVSVLINNKDDAIVESIQVNFKMKNMNMGVNHFMLKNINSKNNKQIWKGTALLPICVTGRADWFSELVVVSKKNKYIISVPISVKQAVN